MTARGAAPQGPLPAADIAFIRSLVIHQDAEVLVLNKPAGLSSQGGRIAARTVDDLLAAFAKPSGVRPRLVHRLDRDTSGVLLAARSQPAAAFLGRAMMARRVRKTYLALVAPGAPDPPAGRVTIPLVRQDIGRDATIRPAPDDPQAWSAETRYRTLSVGDRAALMELSPRTGRMHQLRVHMSAIGRPIVGDPRYGGALAVGGAPAARLMLHAAALAFPHPAGGQLRIQVAAPADLVRLAETVKLTIPDQWLATEAISS